MKDNTSKGGGKDGEDVEWKWKIYGKTRGNRQLYILLWWGPLALCEHNVTSSLQLLIKPSKTQFCWNASIISHRIQILTDLLIRWLILHFFGTGAESCLLGLSLECGEQVIKSPAVTLCDSTTQAITSTSKMHSWQHLIQISQIRNHRGGSMIWGQASQVIILPQEEILDHTWYLSAAVYGIETGVQMLVWVCILYGFVTKRCIKSYLILILGWLWIGLGMFRWLHYVSRFLVKRSV